MQNRYWLRVASALAISAFSSATHGGEPATSDPRDPQRTVTIAVLQAGRSHSRGGNPGPEANFQVFADQACQAAKEHPDVIVVPEYALSGWPYPAEAEIHGLAEPIPGDGRWYLRFVELAKQTQTAILGNMIEIDAGRLYNTAFLVAPDGQFVDKYRKVHANLGEQTWWGLSQGESLSPIEYRGVRYSVSICSDMWFPETIRCEMLAGADVIIHQSIANDMEHIVPTRAFDNSIPVVMAIFQGGCYAVDARGASLGSLPAESPGWKTFDLRPFQVERSNKYGGWLPKQGHLNLRNIAAYGPLVDPATRPAWTEVFVDSKGSPQFREELLARFRGRYDANDPAPLREPLIRFAAPWTSSYFVDPAYPFQLVNSEGDHLFLLGKTAWAYFGCQDPAGVLDRARDQGVNVLRVALFGRPYFEHLKIELWPWGGNPDKPDWSCWNEPYWDEVERRVRLAGECGLGLDICLYMGFNPGDDQIEAQRPYWEMVLRRLSKYANVLTWEIANEHLGNEVFQDAAGTFFRDHDPHRRPVCTSDGTTDDVAWPHKPWVGLAINHSCTSSSPRHDLGDWYLALARNARSHGKPAWCNESGREKRHGNDDGVHRRKQGWLWCAAGAFWTYHSWEGCEGIDDAAYRGPGQEFLKPMADFFQSLPFWRLSPCYTIVHVPSPELVMAVLAENDRATAVGYVCTRETGKLVSDASARVRLPQGEYRISYVRPADGTTLETLQHRSKGLQEVTTLAIPEFTDDVAVKIEVIEQEKRRPIPGTR